MAVGDVVAYREGLLRIARGDVDFLSDDIIGALVDNAYTPDVDGDDDWTDVSGSEIADGDYAAITLGSKTITELGSGNTMFDAADLDYGDAVTISARYLVIYDDSTTPKYLLWYVDLNDGGSANVSSVASDFDVNWPAGGIYQIAP